MKDFHGPAMTLAIALLPVIFLKIVPFPVQPSENGLIVMAYLACFVVTVPGLIIGSVWSVVVLMRKAGGA